MTCRLTPCVARFFYPVFVCACVPVCLCVCVRADHVCGCEKRCPGAGALVCLEEILIVPAHDVRPSLSTSLALTADDHSLLARAQVKELMGDVASASADGHMSHKRPSDADKEM